MNAQKRKVRVLLVVSLAVGVGIWLSFGAGERETTTDPIPLDVPGGSVTPPPPPKPVGPDQVGQETPEAGNGETVVKLLSESPLSGMSYGDVVSRLDKNALPQLYEILEDPKHRRDWLRVSRMIGFLSPRGCTECVSVLVRYGRRNDDWGSWSAVGLLDARAKTQVLLWIGRIGGTEANRVLRMALSREGSEEYAKDWLHGPLPGSWAGNKEHAVSVLQGDAAMGLVYTGERENIELVEELYRSIDAFATSNESYSSLYTGLISAMASRDFIAEYGLIDHLTLPETSDGIFRLKPYIEKYNWRYR